MDLKRSPPGQPLTRFLHIVWANFQSLCMVILGWLEDLIFRHPKIDMEKMRSGRVCVMTGATKGIGVAIFKLLLELDYTVIAGARDVEAMKVQVDKIRKAGVYSGHFRLFPLDLKSLRSVKQFAEKVLACPEANNIHLLVNNAGIYQDVYELTQDNLEVHFQVNYFSHFYLTSLLLPRIKATASANKDGFCHIINTSSGLHYLGALNFDNLAHRKLFVPAWCYFDTKLCQVMHAKTVQAQLEQEGIFNVQMYAAHPGVIATDIWTNIGPLATLLRPIMKALFRSSEAGAHVVLYPALSCQTLDNCSGKYFHSGEERRPNAQADDIFVRQRLQDMSVKLLELINLK